MIPYEGRTPSAGELVKGGRHENGREEVKQKNPAEVTHMQSWLDYLQNRVRGIEQMMSIIASGFVIAVGLIVTQLFAIVDKYMIHDGIIDFSEINLVRSGSLLTIIVVLSIVVVSLLYHLFRGRRLILNIVERLLLNEYRSGKEIKKELDEFRKESVYKEW